jgi:hypothetical protein
MLLKLLCVRSIGGRVLAGSLFGLVVAIVCVVGCPTKTGQNVPDNVSLAEWSEGPAKQVEWESEQMPVPSNGMVGHRAIRLDEGRVMVTGGQSRLGVWLDRTLVYAPSQRQWASGPSLNKARSNHVVVRLNNGRSMVVGGSSARHNTPTRAELFTPEESSWKLSSEAPQSTRRPAAALLPDGDVLFAGMMVAKEKDDSHEDGEAEPKGAVYRYDPQEDAWSEAASLERVPVGSKLVSTEEGAALIGGAAALREGGRLMPKADPNKPIANSQLYDSSADEWQTGPALKHARLAPVVRSMDEGRHLITGWKSLGKSAELFAPGESDTQSIGPPKDARAWSPKLSRLPQGPIIKTGGYTYVVYHPTIGWLELPKLPEPRNGESLTRLNDSGVLVAGGVDNDKNSYQTSLRLKWTEVTDGGVSIGKSASSSAALDARQRAHRAAKQLVLGREEIGKMGKASLESLENSEIRDTWARRSESIAGKPVVSTKPMHNKTGLPVGGSLSALLSRIETVLVNDYPVTVLGSGLTQSILRRERKQQRESDAFDTDRNAAEGKQPQMDYIVTGEATRTDSAGEQDLEVSYRIVIQVINVRTSEVVHQEAVEMTKSASLD